MPVTASPTPNPMAMKFTVGKPMGGPATYTEAGATEDPGLRELLQLEGVISVFVTADFVTVTKSADAEWDVLTPSILEALSSL